MQCPPFLPLELGLYCLVWRLLYISAAYIMRRSTFVSQRVMVGEIKIIWLKKVPRFVPHIFCVSQSVMLAAKKEGTYHARLPFTK